MKGKDPKIDKVIDSMRATLKDYVHIAREPDLIEQFLAETKDGLEKNPGATRFLENRHKRYYPRFTIIEVIVALFIIGILLLIPLQPYFEMRAFNKFSEKKATYWDAMFSELRIEANRVNSTSTE